jgi:hypothetical protein
MECMHTVHPLITSETAPRSWLVEQTLTSSSLFPSHPTYIVRSLRLLLIPPLTHCLSLFLILYFSYISDKALVGERHTCDVLISLPHVQCKVLSVYIQITRNDILNIYPCPKGHTGWNTSYHKNFKPILVIQCIAGKLGRHQL